MSRIWIRNHHDDGWITATWTHLKTAPVPFGETLWRHARTIADRNGSQNTREAEIAAAADELLDRAAAGPQNRSEAERRLTGRTAAASTGRDWPTLTPMDGPALAATPEPPADDRQSDAHDDDVADVIPLPVLDARKEAQTWRL